MYSWTLLPQMPAEVSEHWRLCSTARLQSKRGSMMRHKRALDFITVPVIKRSNHAQFERRPSCSGTDLRRFRLQTFENKKKTGNMCCPCLWCCLSVETAMECQMFMTCFALCLGAVRCGLPSLCSLKNTLLGHNASLWPADPSIAQFLKHPNGCQSTFCDARGPKMLAVLRD